MGARNLPSSLPGVKNIIAVGAGKGGVGKSTVAVLTAIGLARAGAKVGLLDADIYGPSIPKMLGVEDQQPFMVGEDTIAPVEAPAGLKVISMGLLVDPGRPIIWRGPMIHNVLQQFLQQVDWGDLDYLVVDLPPGTGDVPLSLAQSIPITGAIVVCTPQEIALADAVRALKMYQALGVSILGIVENMSYFVCPELHRAARDLRPRRGEAGSRPSWACRSWAVSRSTSASASAATPGHRWPSTNRPTRRPARP